MAPNLGHSKSMPKVVFTNAALLTLFCKRQGLLKSLQQISIGYHNYSWCSEHFSAPPHPVCLHAKYRENCYIKTYWMIIADFKKIRDIYHLGLPWIYNSYLCRTQYKRNYTDIIISLGS